MDVTSIPKYREKRFHRKVSYGAPRNPRKEGCKSNAILGSLLRPSLQKQNSGLARLLMQERSCGQAFINANFISRTNRIGENRLLPIIL